MTTSIERKSGILQYIKGYIRHRAKKMQISGTSIILSSNESGTSVVNVADLIDQTTVSGSVYFSLTDGQMCNVDGYKIVRKDPNLRRGKKN